MDLHVWAAFAAAYFVTTLSPGPNVLLTVRNSLKFGPASALATIAGNLLSQLLVVVLVACGAGAVLATMPQFFTAMKLIGAAYLIWLGIRQIRSARLPRAAAALRPAPEVMSAPRVLREAFLVSFSNPKALIFLSAFMPQFLDQHAPLAPQFALMYGTIAVTVLAVHVVYATLAVRLQGRFARPRAAKALGYGGGGLFVLLGLKLLAGERA